MCMPIPLPMWNSFAHRLKSENLGIRSGVQIKLTNLHQVEYCEDEENGENNY